MVSNSTGDGVFRRLMFDDVLETEDFCVDSVLVAASEAAEREDCLRGEDGWMRRLTVECDLEESTISVMINDFVCLSRGKVVTTYMC